eukprot:2706954-Rhodomonas_salina.1
MIGTNGKLRTSSPTGKQPAEQNTSFVLPPTGLRTTSGRRERRREGEGRCQVGAEEKEEPERERVDAWSTPRRRKRGRG